MGAGGFHGRVRDGIGCGLPARATRSSSLSGTAVSFRLSAVGKQVLVCCVLLACASLLPAVRQADGCQLAAAWMIAAHGGPPCGGRS